MTKLFIISDTHFWHANIIDFCARPFRTVEGMNRQMIYNWNSVVQEGDWVIHGGDFAFGRDATLNRIIDVRQKLNGNIILCRGNHDRIFSRRRWLELIGVQHYLEKHLEHIEIGNYIIVYLKDEACPDLRVQNTEWWQKKIIYVSHRPINNQEVMPYYWGHEHNNMSKKAERELPGKNMSVERIGYMPQLIGEIKL